MIAKSPFFVIEEFISPLLCETILDECDFNGCNRDKEGHPQKTIKFNEQAEQIIYKKILEHLPQWEDHYSFKYKGTDSIVFEWYPTGSNSAPRSENSEYLRDVWIRTRLMDFTGVVFLSDYQDNMPFNDEYEVYGGKLEFAQHQFGFKPNRGTLVLFPSGPHFLNNTSDIMIGDLFQVRFHISAQQVWKYIPQQFPGNYTLWF
jgi:hypothetical protein